MHTIFVHHILNSFFPVFSWNDVEHYSELQRLHEFMVRKRHVSVELLLCRFEHPWPTGRWLGRPSAAETRQHVDSGGCDWSGEWWQCYLCRIAGNVRRTAWLTRECHWALRLPGQAGTDPPGVSCRVWEIWTGNMSLQWPQTSCYSIQKLLHFYLPLMLLFDNWLKTSNNPLFL